MTPKPLTKKDKEKIYCDKCPGNHVCQKKVTENPVARVMNKAPMTERPDREQAPEKGLPVVEDPWGDGFCEVPSGLLMPGGGVLQLSLALVLLVEQGAGGVELLPLGVVMLASVGYGLVLGVPVGDCVPG